MGRRMMYLWMALLSVVLGLKPVQGSSNSASLMEDSASEAQDDRLEGQFAVRIVLPVRWTASRILGFGIQQAPPDSKVVYHALLTRKVISSSEVRDEWRICHIQSPSYRAAIPLHAPEQYSLQYDAAGFEQAVQPTFHSRCEVQRHAQGVTLHCHPVALAWGVTPFGDIHSPLPSWEDIIAKGWVIDSDQDGHVGSSVYAQGDMRPRVTREVFSATRSSQLFVASRLVFFSEQRIGPNGDFLGDVLGRDFFLDVRIVGCILDHSGETCTQDHLRLINDKAVHYQLQEATGAIVGKSLQGPVQCRDVRAAF